MYFKCKKKPYPINYATSCYHCDRRPMEPMPIMFPYYPDTKFVPGGFILDKYDCFVVIRKNKYYGAYPALISKKEYESSSKLKEVSVQTTTYSEYHSYETLSLLKEEIIFSREKAIEMANSFNDKIDGK